MNKEDIMERLRGESWNQISGPAVPKDAISLEALADVLFELARNEKPVQKERLFAGHHELKPGVRFLPNGRFMRNGRFISESEAYK